ncbi:MAG TPA: glycosyltransferase [Planctomycetota bacterium]
MIRVALVIGRLNIGGAEAELARLARGLDRSRFEPFVVTLLDAGPLRDRLGGVEVVELGRKRKWSPGTDGALRDLLRSRKPDVVQSFLFTENLFCRWIGQGAVVSGLQGSLSDAAETGPSVRLWLERRTWPRAAAVVSNSAYYRDLYARLGLDVQKVRVIPSAVEALPTSGKDLRAEWGIRADEVVFTVPARLVERKGHEDVLRAGAGLRLLFAGDGPNRRRLEGRGAILLGARRDMGDVLAASDVVILPSRFGEGCPNAALEAMAAGKPVVAARSGGTPEAVDELLYAPGDVRGLREALLRLAGDPELRRRLGETGRARAAERHAPERMIRAYEDVYIQLTSSRASI